MHFISNQLYILNNKNYNNFVHYPSNGVTGSDIFNYRIILVSCNDKIIECI